MLLQKSRGVHVAQHVRRHVIFQIAACNITVSICAPPQPSITTKCFSSDCAHHRALTDTSAPKIFPLAFDSALGLGPLRTQAVWM